MKSEATKAGAVTIKGKAKEGGAVAIKTKVKKLSFTPINLYRELPTVHYAVRRLLKAAKHASMSGKLIVTNLSTSCLNASSVCFIGYHLLTISDEEYYRDCSNTDRYPLLLNVSSVCFIGYHLLTIGDEEY
jgi:hypothetical protein